MIVTCPQCQKHYRLPDARLGGRARKLRCKGCGQIFLCEPETVEGAAPPAPAPAVGGAVAAAAGPAVLQAPRAAAADSPPLVVVAHDDAAFRGRVEQALRALRCRMETVTDGEQAFRFAVSRRPAVMVLHPRLAGLSGLAVCEGVKGSPDLRATRVALVGPAGWQQTVGRQGDALSFADDRFDATAPAAELARRLAHLLGREEADPVSAPAKPEKQAQVPRAPAEPRVPSVLPDPPGEIRRLARIMLSDLKIYNPDRFNKALADGRFLDVFKEELSRGKDLIAHRFPDLPERLAILAVALREGLEEERAAAGA